MTERDHQHHDIDDVVCPGEVYPLTNRPVPQMMATHTEKDLVALGIDPDRRRVAEAARVAAIGAAEKTPQSLLLGHEASSEGDSLLLEEASALSPALKATFSPGIPSVQRPSKEDEGGVSVTTAEGLGMSDKGTPRVYWTDPGLPDVGFDHHVWLDSCASSHDAAALWRAFGFEATAERIDRLRQMRHPEYLHRDNVTDQVRLVNVDEANPRLLPSGHLVTGTDPEGSQ